MDYNSIYDNIESYINSIDINGIAPTSEPERQYYYILKCKEIISSLSKELGRPLYSSTITFGCQMNSRDSEKLKGILLEIGFFDSTDEITDFVIYNTCTVRENANQKLYGHLGHLKQEKIKNPNMIIALCGCMMQEDHVIEHITKKYKYVDLIFGTHNIYKLAELIYERLTSNKMVVDILKDIDNSVERLPSKRKYDFKSGVNIMYGCNNFCSYCIVPYVRGRERSRVPSEIIHEVMLLSNDGVKEIMLLGQNVNSYGTNFEHKELLSESEKNYNFSDLLSELCKIKGIERIRFMTSHPKDLSDELISVMATNTKICKHLHLPIQSGSTEILNKMNRKYTKEQYLDLVYKIKKQIPNISLSTDIIVGFPGESNDDFNETLDIVDKVQFDQAFTFIYSKRSGTPAANYLEQVPDDIIKERFSKLLSLVTKISSERNNRFYNTLQKVLVEEVNKTDSSLLTGRTEYNTTVHFKGYDTLIGSIVDVKLIESKGFYYIGELIR